MSRQTSEKHFLSWLTSTFPDQAASTRYLTETPSKVSYSCTENMSMIIRKHNRKIINAKPRPTTPTCNFRNKTECLLNGNCLQPSFDYQTTANIKDKPEKVYLGLTEGPWKQRNYGHKFSFNNKKYAHSTVLS